MFREKKIVYLLLFLFFILRVIVCLYVDSGIKLNPDGKEYNNYALTILKDFSWLFRSNFLGSRREPGYPLFLAAVYFFLGKENFLAVYIFQALINTFNILIIYKLALRIFDKGPAFIAFLWSGFYSFYFWFLVNIRRETLIFFFFTLFFYFFYLYLTEVLGKKKRIFIMSLVFFLLIHIDARYLYLLFPIFLLLILYQHFRQASKSFFIFISLTVILSLPWGIRNYIVYDNPVLISTFYFKPAGNIVKEFKYRQQFMNRKTIKVSNNPDYPTEEERKLIKRGLNPNNRSTPEIKAIKKDIYPASTFWQRKWFNLKHLWRPFMLGGIYTPFPVCRFMHWSFRHNLASIISYGLLLPFVFIGFIILIVKKNKVIWFFFLPLFFHTLIHIFVAGEERYRIPIDLFLIILGGLGVNIVYKFFINVWEKYLLSHKRQE